MIAARRLVHQQLADPRFDEPVDVVRWLGAVQAQDYAAARWAVGVRVAGADEAAIERAVDAGAIVRTHALRGTWQLIAPEDVRWMLALVAPRLIAGSDRRNAELGLDAAAYRRSRAAIVRALRDGAAHTRAELAVVLERAGVSPEGQRLSHLLARAELEAVIGSGARRGKQTTHVLLDRSCPVIAVEPREVLLAELARRYFRSRGPATVDDFAWWSGLTAGEARAGHGAIACELVHDGGLWWADGVATSKPPDALLLPAFDEFLVGYRVRDHVITPEDMRRLNAGGGLLAPCVVQGGRVTALWRRVLDRSSVAVEVVPFAPIRGARAITAAAKRYAAFVGRPLELVINAAPRSTSRGR